MYKSYIMDQPWWWYSLLCMRSTWSPFPMYNLCTPEHYHYLQMSSSPSANLAATCDWPKQRNLHLSTKDQWGPWNPRNSLSLREHIWRRDSMPQPLTLQRERAPPPIVCSPMKWLSSINTFKSLRNDATVITRQLEWSFAAMHTYSYNLGVQHNDQYKWGDMQYIVSEMVSTEHIEL